MWNGIRQYVNTLLMGCTVKFDCMGNNYITDGICTSKDKYTLYVECGINVTLAGFS